MTTVHIETRTKFLNKLGITAKNTNFVEHPNFKPVLDFVVNHPSKCNGIYGEKMEQ